MAIAQTPLPPRLKVATQRLVLIGTPPTLTGMLQLANPCGDKLKLKSAAVQFSESIWPDSPDTLRLAMSARVPGGMAVQVPVSLAIDPCMPPGSYHGALLLDGDERSTEVLLHVLEHRALTVIPDSIELYGAPDAKPVIPAVVSNLGNVPVELPKVALFALCEDAALTQLFHVALARKGVEGHQAALDTYAQLVAESEVESVRVLLGTGAGEIILPGMSVETSFTFQLPSRLARHRRYHGTFSIGQVQCRVQLQVTKSPAPQASPQ